MSGKKSLRMALIWCDVIFKCSVRLLLHSRCAGISASIKRLVDEMEAAHVMREPW